MYAATIAELDRDGLVPMKLNTRPTNSHLVLYQDKTVPVSLADYAQELCNDMDFVHCGRVDFPSKILLLIATLPHAESPNKIHPKHKRSQRTTINNIHYSSLSIYSHSLTSPHTFHSELSYTISTHRFLSYTSPLPFSSHASPPKNTNE